MSFLTPLYLLGALAVAAPIIFHLIRRTPKGEVPFSSLMFLSPSPPRLTRRSRLDNVLLLLLRAAALGLLAAAFARPFLRQAGLLDSGEAGGRRVVLLVDTSASLRRGSLWDEARKKAAEVVAACRPSDQLAIYAFDESTRTALSFDEWKSLDPSRREAVARDRVERLKPSWGSTRLGQALVDAAGALADARDATESSARMPRSVVLVSDLQQGSRLDALGDFEWPSDVTLELKTVGDTGSNAGLQRLAAAADEPDAKDKGKPKDAGDDLRVRVANDPGSRREAFKLAWVDGAGAEVGPPVDVYVPPGEGRVVRVPRPPVDKPARSLRLSGDQQGFDNLLYVAEEPKRDANVLYLGVDDPADPAGLLYFLERVFPDTDRRTVKMKARKPADPLTLDSEGTVPLVVVAAELSPSNVAALRAFMKAGVTVLLVVTAPSQAATLAGLAGVDRVDVTDSPDTRDTLLSDIAFDHPLFKPVAGAQFNDFTKVRFWKHRRVDASAMGDARVVARFEGGDPAVVEKASGTGRLVVLASGWAPADSQLARSSKFVPLMAAVLDGGAAGAEVIADYRVGDPAALPAEPAGSAAGYLVHKPDGTAAKTAPGDATFEATDEPGVYVVDTPRGPRPFAVNLDPSESRTSPLNVETLEQFGCRIASANDAAAPLDAEHLRQLRNAELEGRQKAWRWLILAAIVVLILETLVAGRLPRTRPEAAAT